MKALLLSALLLAAPAYADEQDDLDAAEGWFVCLVGRGVIALESQETAKDAAAAMQRAGEQCEMPNADIDFDTVGDHAFEVLTVLAANLKP